MSLLPSHPLLSDVDLIIPCLCRSDYPTVPVGTERLRITPSPLHSAEQTRALVVALQSVWAELGLNTVADWKAEGGRVGVGMENAIAPVTLWTPEQLGLSEPSVDAVVTKNGQVEATV